MGDFYMKIYSDTHVHCYKFEKLDKLLSYAHANLQKKAQQQQHHNAHYVLFFTDGNRDKTCLLYTSPSPRDLSTSRMPSSA